MTSSHVGELAMSNSTEFARMSYLGMVAVILSIIAAPVTAEVINYSNDSAGFDAAIEDKPNLIIDFDSLDLNEIITDQYGAQGVVVSSANGANVIAHTDLYNQPACSAPYAAFVEYNSVGDPLVLRLDFAPPVTCVSLCVVDHDHPLSFTVTTTDGQESTFDVPDGGAYSFLAVCSNPEEIVRVVATGGFSSAGDPDGLGYDDMVLVWNGDCNSNEIPDHTEPDCDGNGIPNDCELDTLVVGSWLLDECAGIDIFDSSGFAHHGTISNPDMWVSPGCDGGGCALGFSGSTSEFGLVSHDSQFDFNGYLCLSACVNPASGPNTLMPVLSKGSTATAYSLQLRDNRVELLLNDGNTLVTSPESIPESMWSHIAATYDSQFARLYINGRLVTVFPLSVPVTNNSEGLYVGLDLPGFPEVFNGQIGEVGISIGLAGGNDCNSNGVPDNCEVESADCNNNGVLDACEHDCDVDGLIDDCDDDDDSDGVPDITDVCPCNAVNLPVDCNGRPLRDCNGDCSVDGLDLQCIVQELLLQ